MSLYTEDPTAGNRYRHEQREQFRRFVDRHRERAHERRAAYFQPDTSSVEAYDASIERYRGAFLEMLGWPLAHRELFSDTAPTAPAETGGDHDGGRVSFPFPAPAPSASTEFVASDDLGRIFRLQIDAIDDLTTYGLLFLPHVEPAPGSGVPLVLALHGGQGTPELCSGLFGPSNYNDMTRRVLRQGFAVFVPQLELWSDDYGPHRDRDVLDRQLKQLGGSITSVEILKLIRSVDYFRSAGRIDGTDIDPRRIGSIGLSYGGFYAIYHAAADTRIRAAVSSCFFNDRLKYAGSDWTWFGAANRFLDAEVGALICPRPLYIEVGANDDHFDALSAETEVKRLSPFYERLHVPDRLTFKMFPGTHELDPADDAIHFLNKWLT